VYLLLKRSIDVLFVLLASPIVVPVIVVTSVAVRVTSGSPVFYRAKRAGLHGQPFVMYKFRTMVLDAERVGGSSTAADDPRITACGRLIRSSKIDELPQLFNVLKGDMSLVGPRPQVLHEVAEYSEHERQVLLMRPGITDWASIRFRNEADILKGHADADEAYRLLIRPEKMRLAVKYVNEASLLTDFRILLDTFRAVLAGVFSKRDTP